MKRKFKLHSLLFLMSYLFTGCGFISEPLEKNNQELVGDDTEVNPTSLKFDKESLTLNVGDKEKITPTFEPAECNKKLDWSSDSLSIVGVDTSGNIVAKKVGKATITAKTINNIEAKCIVEVVDYSVTGITLTLDEIELNVGGTHTITNYKVEPSNSRPNIKFEVASNSTSILSVDNYGKITALAIGQGSVYVYNDENNDGKYNQNIEVYAIFRVSVFTNNDVEITSTVDAPFYDEPSASLDDAPTIKIVNFNMTQTVPYISGTNINKMLSLSSYGLGSLYEYKKYSNYYSIDAYSGTSGGAIRFYPSDNLMVLYNWQNYISIRYSKNNSLPLDVCSPNSSTILKGSDKTKILTNHKTEVNIQLSNYSLRILEYNNELYVPFDIVSSFVFHSFDNFVFDGAKIYEPRGCGDKSNYTNKINKIPFFFSSENAFSIDDNNFGRVTFYKQDNSNSNYKYVYRTTNPDDYTMYINGEMIFKNDGTGTYVCGANSSGSYSSFLDNFKYTYNFTYEEDTSKKIIKIKKSGSSDFNYYIGTTASQFGKNEFTVGYKEYWYNTLCLKLDYFYGLKHKLTSGSFVDFFKNNRLSIYKNSYSQTVGTKEQEDTIYNLVRNASTVDQATSIVINLFEYYFGEGHSSFESTSPLGSLCEYAANRLSINNISDRSKALSQTNSTLKNLKKERLSLSSNTDKVYYDTDKKLAMLQFSKFSTSTISKGTVNYTSYENSSLDYSSSVNTEGFKCIAKELSAIKNISSVKNIIFDTTLNGGGQARLIPLLYAFMTNDPIMVVRSTVTGGVTEYHYTVDLNGDGTYGGSGDTLASRFKFFIFQSNYSFSSGTAFSAVAKLTGAATVVGDQRSGGGSCIVAYGNDAIGNTFQNSGALEIMMPDGNGGFVSDDDGVIADQVISRDYFYNPNALVTLIHGLEV